MTKSIAEWITDLSNSGYQVRQGQSRSTRNTNHLPDDPGGSCSCSYWVFPVSLCRQPWRLLVQI